MRKLLLISALLSTIALAGNLQQAPRNRPRNITLTWIASPDTGVTYTVYRSVTSGTAYQKIASGITTLSYVDTKQKTGTYFYVVTAVNPNGESPPSNEARAVVP
jgi:fibronectin type 3 domain-containing protein